MKLWGMIRVAQMLILACLINIVFPVEVMIFFQGAMVFANMDLLDGKHLYDATFEYKETTAFSHKFDQSDIGDKNFMMNSGSFLILQVFIVIQKPIRKWILKLTLKCSRFSAARWVGMRC